MSKSRDTSTPVGSTRTPPPSLTSTTHPSSIPSDMRNMSVIGVVAVAGLLSHGALALPMPSRIIYPYPIYRSDEVEAFALKPLFKPMDSSQARLDIFSAAFSKAIDVGFVTAILRPHEHLVSFLRYYNPKNRDALPHTVSPSNFRRSVDSVELAAKLLSKSLVPRDSSGGPDVFRSHAYRRSDDRVDDKRSLLHHDYRRGKPSPDNPSGYQYHHYTRKEESARSSTHSTSKEHLKAREVDDLPPRQPPARNLQ